MAPKTGNNQSTPAQESNQDDDMISKTSRDSKQPTPTETSETGAQEFPDAANAGQGQEAEEKEVEGAGEDEREAGSSKEKDGANNKRGKGKEPKEKRMRSVKMNWTDEARDPLRLIMVGGKVEGKHAGAIAQTFREKPTSKAIEERMSKERALGRDEIIARGLENTIELNYGRTKKRDANTVDEDDGEAPVPDSTTGNVGPGPSRRRFKRQKASHTAQTGVDPPEIDQEELVFGQYPVTWSQLPHNLVDQVKKAAEKAAREARLPGLIAMHKKKLAEQHERERKAEADAATALISMGEDDEESDGAGAVGSSSRPETEAERQVREQIAELTGYWGSGSKEGGGDEEGNEGGEDGDAPAEN